MKDNMIENANIVLWLIRLSYRMTWSWFVLRLGLLMVNHIFCTSFVLEWLQDIEFQCLCLFYSSTVICECEIKLDEMQDERNSEKTDGDMTLDLCFSVINVGKLFNDENMRWL